MENDRLAREWQGLIAAQSPNLLATISTAVEQNRAELAEHFYAHMLQHHAASEFLSHDLVKSRLGQSMQTWLIDLFDVHSVQHVRALVAQQVKIGEIHARIGIPVHLVLRGARCLKARLNELLAGRGVGYVSHVSSVINLAIEIMSQAYSLSHERQSRAEEAYRLFAVAQNVAHERDKQRAALLDWENRLIFDCAVGLKSGQFGTIKTSEFGLWFRHKGAHAFSGAAETSLILDAMDEIDDTLLPLFDLPSTQAAEHRLQCLRDLRERSKSIIHHMDLLFDQHGELEAGRDVLTRLLNRKFLAAVLSKEVSYARQHNARFAVLAVDVDHFKRINDTYGHEGGDSVLQQLAALLANSVRGGDYVFRMGGEEFLLVLVDVGKDDAMRVAEKVRKQVAKESFLLPQDRSLHVTVSVGLALYDWHPDYQRMLRSADDALYRAKAEGRNRVSVAD